MRKGKKAVAAFRIKGRLCIYDFHVTIGKKEKMKNGEK